MTTAVVVATVVETNMSEAAFRNAVLEQIRDNEQNLLATLAGADEEANIVTAILNVEEFMKYMLQRFPRPAETAPYAEEHAAASTTAQPAANQASIKTTVLGEGMSEIDFMNHMLDQVEAGTRLPTVRFSEDELQALDEEAIGEDFARHPFLY